MPGCICHAKARIPEAHCFDLAAPALCRQHGVYRPHALPNHQNIVPIRKAKTFHIVKNRHSIPHFGGDRHILLCTVTGTIAVEVKAYACNSVIRQHPRNIIAPASIRIQAMKQNRNGDLPFVFLRNGQRPPQCIASGATAYLPLFPLGRLRHISGRLIFPIAVICCRCGQRSKGACNHQCQRQPQGRQPCPFMSLHFDLLSHF